jgi:hypothetical protein
MARSARFSNVSLTTPMLSLNLEMYLGVPWDVRV